MSGSPHSTAILELLRRMAAIDAVSGQEQPMVRHVVDIMGPVCDSVEVDAVGNVYAVKQGAEPGPTVMIAAHTDEIGLVVKSVEPSGFIRFDKVGGVLDNLLAARLVRVRGELGVIGMKAGHYQSAQERSSVRPHTQAYIDIGATSAQEVYERGIGIGDPIVFVSDIVELGGARRLVAGKAIDDRLGCAVLALLMAEATPPAGTLVAAFTTQEEVGLKGAGVAGFRIQPTLGLALDTMPTGDTPDMSLTTDLGVVLGGGPCLQVLSGEGGKGFLIHPAVKAYLVRTAEAANVPLQLNTFTGGNNDAATIAWSGRGVPAASICLPRRYSHSPLEVADLADAAMAFELLSTVVAQMASLPSFDFASA